MWVELLIQSIKLFFLRFIESTRGSVLPFVALSLPIILGTVGLGTDAGMWLSEKRHLQRAADAAVLSATWELAYKSENTMKTVAYDEALKNGLNTSRGGQMVLTEADNDIIWVTLSQRTELFFSSLIFEAAPTVSVSAAAQVDQHPSQFCVLALDESVDDAFTTYGSSDVNTPECSVAVNSKSDQAFTLSGSAAVTLGDIYIAGQSEIGSNVDFTYDTMKEGKRPIEDPYAGLEVPDFNKCDYTNFHVSSDTTLSPGVYCKGLAISGTNDVVMEPGVYIIDGGTFKVTGGGSLIGNGVTIILTGSGNNYAQVDISGGRYVELSAPLKGEEWAGIVFYQDREAPQKDNLENKITGSNDIIFDGAAYFPSQGLWFGGNTTIATEEEACTQLIARTVTIAGNPRMGNNCDEYGVEIFSPPSVDLIF